MKKEQRNGNYQKNNNLIQLSVEEKEIEKKIYALANICWGLDVTAYEFSFYVINWLVWRVINV